MKRPTAVLKELGRHIWAHESGGSLSKNPDQLVTVSERLFEKCWKQLGRLMSAPGSDALIMRSSFLAKSEFPACKAIELRAGGVISGVRECAGEVGTTEVESFLSAVITNLVWLLVTFIGEDLTLRFLQSVWPEIRLEKSNIASRESIDE